jgi:hypothetical protein
MSWVDALALRKDEKVVDSWQGIREIIGQTFDVSLERDKKEHKKVVTRERKEGLLVLTNQRLLFLEGQEPDGKQLGEAVKISLIDLDKLWFEKAPLKPIDQPAGLDTYVFSLKKVGKKKEFNQFKKLVDEYCKKRKETLEKETRKVFRFKIT